MERKMLLGIKERAERLARERLAEAAGAADAAAGTTSPAVVAVAEPSERAPDPRPAPVDERDPSPARA